MKNKQVNKGWNNASGDYAQRITDAQSNVDELNKSLAETQASYKKSEEALAYYSRMHAEATSSHSNASSRASRAMYFRDMNKWSGLESTQRATSIRLKGVVDSLVVQLKNANDILTGFIDAKNDELVIEAKNKANELTAKMAKEQVDAQVMKDQIDANKPITIAPPVSEESDNTIKYIAGGVGILMIGVIIVLIAKK